jgi:tartrate dehydratase beta subunit/fumarate hydratase class I family protein
MKTTIAFLLLAGYACSALAGTAYLVSERTKGMNKICFYDYLGTESAINVKPTELCPLTIQVP